MSKYEKLKEILDMLSDLAEGKPKIACAILKESINLAQTLQDKLEIIVNPDNFNKFSEETLLTVLSTIRQCKKELDKCTLGEITTTLN